MSQRLRGARVLLPLIPILMAAFATDLAEAAPAARSAAVRADKVRPKVVLRAPRVVRGVVAGGRCRARASDNVRVARVLLFVDGRRVATRRGRRATCRWNTRRVRDGRHVLRATAYDAAGNSRTVRRRVTVRNDAVARTAQPAQPVVQRSIQSGLASYTPVQIAGTAYYVSSQGSDSNPGTSPASPWRTVARANRASLQPGDGILFEGGATFADDTLMPEASGTASRQIVFGSYGAGRAVLRKGVWFRKYDHLVFQGLEMSGSDKGVLGEGAGIVVQGCTLVDLGIGLNVFGSGWTILGNTVERIADSGLIVQGEGHSIAGNVIATTGTDSSIPYGKHGIYLKAAGSRVAGNVIRDFSASGVSARFHDSTIEQNTISGGPIGIGWHQNDPVGGRSHWRDNEISGTTAAAIYVSAEDSAGATRERFTITGNTLRPTRGNHIDIETPSPLDEVLSNTLL